MGKDSWSATRRRAGFGGTGRGGKRPQEIDVSGMQGMTLQELESRIRGLDHEEMYIIDADGNIIAGYRGDDSSVSFYARDLFRDGATVTHNHPVGAEGYGGTFSFKDMLNFAASDWAEHRATASGQGEMNYIARATSRTTAADRRGLYTRISNDMPSLNRQMKAALAASSDKSATARRQIYTGILDRYYATVLPQYNFEYVVRKNPYRYNR